MKKIAALLATGASLAWAGTDLSLESLEDLLSMETAMEADVGARDKSHTSLASKVPIDIIGQEEIETSGATSLTDLLRYAVAGFNAPKPPIADGSSLVRAYTLRGMSSDQILVLLNGKRLHASALLHVNGVIGRGSSHTDLEAIPLRAIEKIEILRDGAAAQYGSDAISGVINIILKGNGYRNAVAAHAGTTGEGDGRRTRADAFVSLPLRYDGYLNLTLDGEVRDHTQRAGNDRRVTPSYQTTRVGTPDLESYKALANALWVRENGIEIYADALVHRRNTETNAFFRTGSDDSAPIHPDGFMPRIEGEITDLSLTAGLRGKNRMGVQWDLSHIHGSDAIRYFMHNTMNYSLGADSPTSFDNGELKATQCTTNLDLKKELGRLSLSGGMEYRQEGYRIDRGEEASYYMTGSQGFSGYREENAVDAKRNSHALYLDATYQPNDRTSVKAAGRHQSYSDFGSTTNAKAAFSYNLSEPLMFRGSASTGFRAPSLAQSYYSQTSTYVDGDGDLITQGTYRVDHPVSEALGAEALEAEKSRHLTVGSTYAYAQDGAAMVDFYLTEVDNRIMMSDELPVGSEMAAEYGVSRARYFTNAIDTRTRGVDVKVEYTHTLPGGSRLFHRLWCNYNLNEITGANTAAFSDANSYDQIVALEHGRPRFSMKFYQTYEIGSYKAALNLSRYGAYSEARSGVKYDFGPSWTVDADLAYRVAENLKVALGGKNIFDTMPEKWDGLSGDYIGYDGVLPYSRYAPIGHNGAYYYARAHYTF